MVCFLKGVIQDVFLERGYLWAQEQSMCLVYKFNGLLSTFGFTCLVDPTVLSKKTKGSVVILTIYIDDILLARSDDTGIHAIKTYLQQHLNICNMGDRKYFLGIDFDYEDGKLVQT